MSNAQTHTDRTTIVDQLQTFLRRYYHDDVGELAQHYPGDQRSLYVDWLDLYQFDQQLADDLLDQPATMTDYFEEALRTYDLPIDVSLERAHARVYNLPSTLDVANVSREQHVGRLLAVEGRVQKTSQVKPKITEAAFECQRCGTLTRVPQSDDTFQEPHECQGCERQGPFTINWDQSEYVNNQYLRLQQPLSESRRGNAADITVRLEDDLVTAAAPGDRVTINGILHLESATNSKDSPTFNTYLKAVSVATEESDYEDVTVDDHLEEVRAIANGERGDPYELIVDSINPRHHGDRHIKLAIALQLFGGWPRDHPDGSTERGDSHICLIGDPGCGKSTHLQAVDNLAVRSTMASGKGASAAGLTASAVKDDFGDGQQWTLDAGALVLADGGIACIDELDKVPEDAVSALHGALESQEVHVNKAGINARLSAQTSLLAAGNPREGRFDDYEDWASQIDIDPPLLSRFDLIYLVSDQPDEEDDRAVVRHKMESRYVAGKHERGDDLTDQERETVEPAISPDVLRAYIAHAKSTCFPLLEDEAVRERLEDYFVTLRQAGDGDGPVPVTLRKQEAIERLAEASARVRLSDTVELVDVERAVDLVEQSMKQVGVDPESGELDADIVETGSSKSQRDRKRAIIDVLRELQPLAVEDAAAELAAEIDASTSVVEDELETLRTQDGKVYEQNGHLRVV